MPEDVARVRGKTVEEVAPAVMLRRIGEASERAARSAPAGRDSCGADWEAQEGVATGAVFEPDDTGVSKE